MLHLIGDRVYHHVDSLPHAPERLLADPFDPDLVEEALAVERVCWRDCVFTSGVTP